MFQKFFLLLTFAAASASTAHASGFEKSVLWSGKEAGYAGAGAVSRVSDSQATFFNPAGLAGSENGDVSLNFSPTDLRVTGNPVSTLKQETTDQNFIPAGGASAAFKLTKQFGIGVAASVAGGSRAIYDGVDLTPDSANVSFKPRISTDFSLIEYALGMGYEVAPGWRVGAAWRILSAKGNLATLQKTTAGTAFTYANLANLSDTEYTGFRLGLQYDALDDLWGFGLTFRNKVDVKAKGNSNSGDVVTIANSHVASTVSETTVTTSLPLEVSLGGHYKLNDSFRLLGGVDYVNYANNQNLGISGSFTSLAFAAVGGTVALPSIVLNWSDMWNFRVGGEYTGIRGLALRAGYALTTRVVSQTNARATLPPPGTGHMFTLGAGTSLLANKLDLDGALEYAFSSGDGTMSAATPGALTRDLLASTSSTTSARSIAAHLGATYKF